MLSALITEKTLTYFIIFLSCRLVPTLTFYIVWLGKQIMKSNTEINFIEKRIYLQLSALMFCKQALNTGLWIDVKYAQLPMLLHLNKHWTLRRIGNELISTVLIVFFNNSCVSGTRLKIRFYFYSMLFISSIQENHNPFFKNWVVYFYIKKVLYNRIFLDVILDNYNFLIDISFLDILDLKMLFTC